MALKISLADAARVGIAPRPGAQTSPTIGTATGRLERFGREQFDQYRTGGLAAERRLIADAGVRTRADIDRIGGEASDLVSRAFTSSRGTLERQRRALGVRQDEREQASTNRRLGLAQVLSDVGARNNALRADQERREQLRVSAGSLRDIIDQGALGGLSGAARAETGRRLEFEQAMADYDANKDAALGQLAGIGLSFVPGLGGAAGALV